MCVVLYALFDTAVVAVCWCSATFCFCHCAIGLMCYAVLSGARLVSLGVLGVLNCQMKAYSAAQSHLIS